MDTDVLEDDRSKVQVCVRVKPLTAKEARSGAKRCAVAHDNCVILGAKDPKMFTFDAVADEASKQEEIFAMVGKSITDSCIAGYNGSIFAYGQTGSGKTHTIQGAMTPSGEFLPGMKGLIPRVLDHMYFLMDQSEKASLGSVRFECRCSFLEIYKEKIMDLLNPTMLDLSIREDIKRGIYVENLTEQPVSSTAEALEVLRVGAANRHVAATGCNEFSSRSHSVFTITIKSKARQGLEEKNGVVQTRYSRLNLIDLAGSERQKLSQTKGEQLKEAGHINKSLALLGNVIRALVEIAGGKHRHVPYRDSKLTFLLKDSLGGNSKTTIIATISPLDTAFAETLSTLKFAQRAKLIQNKAVVNQDLDGGSNYAQYAQLQRELKRVREQLAMEKARNQFADTSMAVVPQNGALRTRRNDIAAQPLATNQAQNEHVRRLEALLNQLKSYETIEDERRRLREGNAHLKEQCASKDKFVQSARALIKLRDATIESLQKKTPRTGRSENEALRQEIQQLKAMVENHPELLKHARESHNRKTKLQEYKRLFGDNMKVYWAEIGKAQYLAKELSTYLERVKSGSKGGQATYEALLASPVASTTDKKRVGWADTTATTTEAQPMNWSLISKRQKTVESDAAQPSEAAPVAVARKARDARKSIAWFNHEYEEEHSWDLETSTTTLDGGNHHKADEEAAEGTTAGLTKEQAAALEKALHGLEDKLREEQIMRNQIELLLEEEKARSSLELTKWQSEFALAQQQIDALVHEKNSLSSDLTVKNERLRSLNQNFLMTKGSTAASSSSGSMGSSKSRSSDSSDEEEFGDWSDVRKGFDNDDDGYEPVSLRRLTMGVGLLRRANAAAQDKQQMKLAKKQKKRMGSFGGDGGDLLDADEDDNNVAAKAAKKSRKQNINEVRMLDLERRLAEKENEIERLQDKFNNMKEEYEVLIEEKRFREEEVSSATAATTTATTEGATTPQQLHAAQFVHEVEEMERRMKERNLEYEREVMRLREDIDDRQREWEAERQERDERERRLVASLDAAEGERALRETELEGLHREIDEVREEMRREISGYVSKMGEMGRLFGEKRRELEEEHLDHLQRALGERDEARAQAAQQAKAGERVVAARDEEIEHLTRELEAAEAKSQEVSRRLAQLADEQAADYERRIDSLNREVEAMQRLSDGELAKLQLELDRRALEFETEKERRDHRERELDEAKAEALDQQRRYYEKEMTRIKEEMARQWAEWENRGREDERETKGMILRLNEEKEELIARARKDRDDAQLEHQRTAALLEDRLRQTADAAQATEARLRGELSRIEEELAAVAEAKAALELRTDEQRRAFEQQIAGLESSIAATSHELTAELGVLRDELDAAQRANRDLQSTHDAEREQLARDSESAIATLRAAHDAELAQQAAGRESEAETLRVAHDAALEQLTTLLSAKASEVEALERLVREKESEIESAKDDARRERDELATLHLGQRAELAAALEAKEREMAELREVEARARREVEERAAAEVTRLEQAKKAELTELEEKHGREIEELTAQEKRMMHDFAVMKEEIEKSINERIDYIKQIETRRQAERQAQDEIARLNDTITRMQKDFKSLMQEKHQLEARVEELVLINGKLTGHQNLNQKIQHHVKVKQENNSLKIQLQKLKKELDRTKSELAKFRPEGSVDLAADEDEEEKLKKQLAQQEEVIGALDAQLKALRGQLSSLYNAHIGSTTATLTGGDAVSSDETTEAEDASFSFEVVLDQLGLKLKGMSQEISDLHFKKLLLERENALYAKKSQHGLSFSSSSATTTASTAEPVVPSPAPTSSSSSSSSSSAIPASSSSSSSHALADVTNFEFNASPAASSPTIALKEAATTKAATATVHNADKENAVAAATTKEKPSRSGSRREPRGEAKERGATATDSSSKRRPREEREATASGSSGSGTGGGKERRVRMAVLQRTLSSASNRP